MTCIVGLIEDQKVYIGGDSAGVAGYQLSVRKDRKVFCNGDFVIGGTTSFRMLQLLHYSLIPPKCEDDDIERYMVTKFVDAIRECFKAGGYAQKEREQEEGGTFLVGFQGRLFRISSDYQVGETLCGYDAIGCGDNVALGSLVATPDMQATKRVELALRAAESHNIGVRGPFYIESIG